MNLFQLRKEIPRGVYYAAAVAGFVSFGLLYTWVSHQAWANHTFIPRPSIILQSLGTILQGPELWQDLKASLGRVTGGFLAAAILAIPLGLLMGSFRIAESFFQPLIEFMRYVPVPALIPLIMIFCGIGEGAKITLILVGTFFQLVLMVADEVRRVPYDLIQCSQTLGATRSEIIFRVLARAARPGIFDALRLCNGWAWTYVIVAELVAANEGLGYRILRFYRFIQTPRIFVYLIILGAVGLLLDFLFRKMNAHLFSWADTSKR